MSATHVLKVAPPYMDALLSGAKPFEVRRNDRAFQTGDLLLLWEYDGQPSYRPCDRWDCRDHKHRRLLRLVNFVYSGDPSLRDCGGVLPGYVVLGLGAVSRGDIVNSKVAMKAEASQ